jgi:CheY-like chemotaxis protein
LATALGIINAHDGFITVDSKVGAGSTFKVYLPATPAGTHATVEVEHAPASAGRGVQILVVDDEAQFRDAIRHVLQNQGYAVLTASHGQEAVSVFNQHSESVSVICTDVMMPVMNGPALIRALRVLKPDLKVIACTGLLESKHRQDLEELGVGEILMKPFQARDVLAAIERQLAAD